MTSAPGMDDMELSCKEVCLSFGGIDALVDVSMNVQKGSTTAIIGPNGAGKTSLLNCISGYYRAKSGSINLRGLDITRSRPYAIAARGLARTFQHSELQLGDSVLANIEVGRHLKAGYGIVAAALHTPNVLRRERESRTRAAELAEFVGLGGVMNRPAGQLSYGHQKLIEVARALATDPLLLLLDEPTAGMNYEEKARVAEVMYRMKSELGLTQILIEHDVKFVRATCDRAVALNFGRLMASGTPASVLQDPGVITAYVGG